MLLSLQRRGVGGIWIKRQIQGFIHKITDEHEHVIPTSVKDLADNEGFIYYNS